MEEHTKRQMGSPSRDLFKFKHKSINKNFWACDLDFVLVHKSPFPDIIAIIDYKKDAFDTVTFTEVIAFNALSLRGLDVYIVTGDAETGVFSIQRYVGGHHGAPRAEFEDIAKTSNWQDFEEWEGRLRATHIDRFKI